jgi:NTE family protein
MAPGAWPLSRAVRAWCAVPWLLWLALATPAWAAADEQARRPRIGLVLSGGGARGLAHVGVLKVLEQARVQVDVIAGTSMGAIIGGLYASGMSAEEIETELRKVQWDAVFANRVDRQHLTQRRKEEDFDISPVLELGMHEGEMRAPLGALSSRGLETLLRRYTLPVHHITRFDDLAIRFRAVATDMETGRAVIMDEGDLALALRSSMSVPGVFPPTEVDGRILGDGGLVNNLPIDVARALGADIVIVVNIGTPLSKRSTLNSVGGITGQMINILTEQNVQNSLRLMKPGDLLIQPDLGTLTSSDFNQTETLVRLGEETATGMLAPLRAHASTPEAFAQWQQGRRRPPAAPHRIAAIEFEGSTLTRPQRLATQLASRVGEAFDAGRAEWDVQHLAASGDYVRVDYQLVPRPDGDKLVFDLEDKPWGPHYLRVGLDLSTDFSGRSAFNLKLSHNRHWLDEHGTEWRNRVQIGEVPLWTSELYRPFGGRNESEWFVAGYAGVQRRELIAYQDGTLIQRGRYTRTGARAGVDLGQPWSQFGEWRVGLTRLDLRTSPDIVAAGSPSGAERPVTASENGLRAAVVMDQLDFANFPQHGYRAQGEAMLGEQREDGQSPASFRRLEAQASTVGTWGAHTLNAHAQLRTSSSAPSTGLGRYTLGGFHQLSGYLPNQLEGNATLLGRLIYYQRLPQAPVLTRGLFVGGSLEAGNAWSRWRNASLQELRAGMSLFVGADTGLGPMYLGLTHAPHGTTGLYLFIGRP